MIARVRGFLVLLYAAVSMPLIFFVSLPVMLATGSGDLPIWFGRRLWGPLGLWLAGARLEIAARPRVPDGPVVFASNHESALDIWALFASIPRSFRFIAKQELFDLPVFGWYMRLGGHVPVDRSNRSQAVASLRHASALVRAGTSVIAFPEGTRSRTGRVEAFKKGPFALAKDAGVPVVPIAISGSGAVTPTKTIAVHPGTIRLAFGEPVDPAAFPTREALLAEVRARIIALHRGLGGLGGDLGRAVAAPGVEGSDERGGTAAAPHRDGRT